MYEYENPFELEDRLKELKEELENRIEAGEDMENLIDLEIEIEDVRQRINFAWQDYDEATRWAEE